MDAHYNLGLVHEARDDFEAAIGAYRKVLALEPGHLEAQLRFVERLFLCQRPAEALAAADAGLAADPVNVNAMVMKATVLAALGARDAEAVFVDFDRLLWHDTLAPPQGLASQEALNRALADHVRSHPTLAVDPPDRTTRSGKQSGDLLHEPLGPMGPWAERIDAAVHGYLTQLPRDADHPFLARRPTRWRLSAWGVVLSRHGHQLPHTHPSGWGERRVLREGPGVGARPSAQGRRLDRVRPPRLALHVRTRPEGEVDRAGGGHGGAVPLISLAPNRAAE